MIRSPWRFDRGARPPPGSRHGSGGQRPARSASLSVPTPASAFKTGRRCDRQTSVGTRGDSRCDRQTSVEPRRDIRCDRQTSPGTRSDSRCGARFVTAWSSDFRFKVQFTPSTRSDRRCDLIETPITRSDSRCDRIETIVAVSDNRCRPTHAARPFCLEAPRGQGAMLRSPAPEAPRRFLCRKHAHSTSSLAALREKRSFFCHALVARILLTSRAQLV